MDWGPRIFMTETEICRTEIMRVYSAETPSSLTISHNDWWLGDQVLSKSRGRGLLSNLTPRVTRG